MNKKKARWLASHLYIFSKHDRHKYRRLPFSIASGETQYQFAWVNGKSRGRQRSWKNGFSTKGMVGITPWPNVRWDSAAYEARKFHLVLSYLLFKGSFENGSEHGRKWPLGKVAQLDLIITFNLNTNVVKIISTNDLNLNHF